MKRNNFAVFILSHGRADTMTTLSAILKAGYLGDYYIIVDDLDKQKDRYIEKYGAAHVIVFDKNAWMEKTDTITKTGENRSPVFARNACYEIAKNLGLDYFTEFDDDLHSFSFRYVENGKLKAAPISDLDSVFEMLVDFMEKSGAISVGLSSANGMIGGANGKYKDGLLYSIHQAFICRTDKRIEFKGILNEDGIATEIYSNSGKMPFEVVCINQSSPVRSTNAGGLKELYEANDEYIRAFYSIIAAPWCLRIVKKKNGFITSRKSENAQPKILSERWRKSA